MNHVLVLMPFAALCAVISMCRVKPYTFQVPLCHDCDDTVARLQTPFI